MASVHSTDIGCGRVIGHQHAEIDALCRRFGVRRLDLFGSAAEDHFDAERSDIDLLVEFEPSPGAGYLRRRIASPRRTLYPT